jgi:hypothetical protein
MSDYYYGSVLCGRCGERVATQTVELDSMGLVRFYCDGCYGEVLKSMAEWLRDIKGEMSNGTNRLTNRRHPTSPYR